MNCEKLLNDAILQTRKSQMEFDEANNSTSKSTFDMKRLQAQNHRGYAEGIYQCLLLLGYKGKKLRELGELL